MATTAMILSESGMGKSTAIRNLQVENTAIINVLGKPLPFRGGDKFITRISDKPEIIKQILAKINEAQQIKVVVIDDFQYIMANMYMESLLDKKTKDSEFQKYKEIGHSAWSVIREAQKMRNDMVIFFLSHTEIDQNGKTKCKTIGKMLDEKVTLEGMFTIVLNGVIHMDRPIESRYCFQTQNDGNNTTKSPMGMFDQEEIPNDLNVVYESIKSYYGGV
jgi:hypothetical protein